MSSTTSAQYILADHVFACRCARHIVMLDLRADKYLALDLEDAQGLPPIERLPFPHPSDKRNPHCNSDTLQSLIRNGLIVNRTTTSAGLTPVATSTATREWPHATSLYTNPQGAEFATGVRIVARYLHALVLSAFQRRCLPIASVARRMIGDHERLTRSQERPEEMSVAKALASFKALRVLTYTARDHCFFDCLTLKHFLTRNSIHTSWVFGVRTEPFSAHCWVEWNDFVLSDSLEHIHNYTPILVL